MASVKCPKCGNLIAGVTAGETVKCLKCGNTMKLAVGANSAATTAVTKTVSGTKVDIKEDSAVKGLGIALIVVGVIGIFLGMMMFGDIGVACFVGSITALLTGIALLQVASAIKKLRRI